ncbi:hypothetical protein LOTGIDRAFT_122144 [Lottia gigantea]|uniref:Ubiquitin-conjugating enzyme E2 T n=1 Tax=Lottia gigantea TaxID=225164 RepID=V4BRM9_LOTGI|nr:hypothetical protein LOTGIDRAFT_122144 [Lottia gigantea]ESO91554.1 hypothetical protein LOTGIDRAFT_122144 [Lottia gigantea]
MMKTNRMNRELKAFGENPPFGISCWRSENSTAELEAQILGGEGTPYEKGVFKLEIDVPDKYPLVPPKVRFITSIYHPNIDNAGRICLDILKMPPQGAWQPMLRLSTVLQSIQLLMAEPNPEDPLMTEIASEYKYNKPAFNKHAEEFTRKFAMVCIFLYIFGLNGLEFSLIPTFSSVPLSSFKHNFRLSFSIHMLLGLLMIKIAILP